MKILLLLAATIVLTTSTAAQQKSVCDLSDYKTISFSHVLDRPGVKIVKPQYPNIARAVNAAGKVSVEIIVDRAGNVVDSCVTKGHPLLKFAAKNAAIQSKFGKDFGLSATFQPNIMYLRTTLVFDFAR